MSVPWRDKAGITHAWKSPERSGPYREWMQDNHHAGWYTARAPCGASRRIRQGPSEEEIRPRDAMIDCMTCLTREGENDQ